MITLRYRLLLIVMIVLLPALGLTLYSDVERRDLDRKAALSEAHRLARGLAIDYGLIIENTRHMLATLSQVPQLQEGGRENCAEMLGRIYRQSRWYSALTMASPDGRVLASAPSFSKPVDQSTSPWFKRVLKTRRFVVGEYQKGRITGKNIVVMAYPVIDDAGRVRRVLSAGLDLEWLSEIASRIKLPSGTTLTAFDEKGTIVVRNIEPGKYVGKTMPDAPLVKAVMGMKEGVFEGPGLSGESRLFGFASFGEPDGRIYLTVGIPRNVAFSSANKMLARNILLLLSVTVLGITGAWLFSNHSIVRPLNRLVEATAKLATGDFAVRSGIASGNWEIGHLSKAFDAMAEALQQREAERTSSQNRIEKLNRILKTLSEVNQLIVREKDEHALLSEACRILVEHGRFKMAWIGMADYKTFTVNPVARAGDVGEYLDGIRIRFDNTPEGYGPTGAAIRKARTVMCTETETDEAYAPWREAARIHGYRSSVALPISVRHVVKGALNVYSSEPDAFDRETIELLEELAGDIGFAMQNFLDVRERREAEERVERHIRQLAALRTIDMAITSSLDLRLTLDVFTNEVTSQLGVDAASVLLVDPHTMRLEYAAGRGFKTDGIKRSALRLGEGYAGRAALERKITSCGDMLRECVDFTRSKLIMDEGFRAYFGVPLIVKGHVKGVLEIFHRGLLDPTQEWLDFLEALAGQAAIAIDNAALFDDLQRTNNDLVIAYDATIEGWSRALDYRDKETEGHSQRVTEMTLLIAKEMGIHDDELVHIRRGALLHDIGKLGVPDSVLLKPGKLTDEEWAVMKSHPEIAYNILSPIPYLKQALDIPYCHHEKWDGTGYPRGLRGDQIPLAARIFAIVDVWDALLSDRPYRPAWPKGKVMAHMRDNAAGHFDPDVLNVFFGISWQK